jgi:hypothetical protein
MELAHYCTQCRALVLAVLTWVLLPESKQDVCTDILRDIHAHGQCAMKAYRRKEYHIFRISTLGIKRPFLRWVGSYRPKLYVTCEDDGE